MLIYGVLVGFDIDDRLTSSGRTRLSRGGFGFWIACSENETKSAVGVTSRPLAVLAI